MNNSYDSFSRFYRELVYASGHIKLEQDLALSLLSNFNINYDANILDAACGTGDVIAYLISHGFYYSNGMDSSLGMLERAIELLPQNHLMHLSWEELSSHSEMQNSYNVIFVLSLSLLHADEKNIQQILRNFYGLLKNDGILFFDNRKWINDDENNLKEPHRDTQNNRFLQHIYKDHNSYKIFDACTYKSNRQVVTYKIQPTGENSRIIELDVSYMIKKSEEFLTLLFDIGFKTTSILASSTWPYQIIYAKK